METSPPGGLCSTNQIRDPLLAKRPQPTEPHRVPADQQGLPSLTQRHPRREGLPPAVPSAGPALLTQQRTPCVNACQLLPWPLFAQAASLCLPFRGSRWQEMAFQPPANGARQLQAPAPRILQHLRSSSPCPAQAAQRLQPISKTQIKSSTEL